ncbi:uncharacterized protein LOC135388682 [Ornithodoros turicata]|uniref:uncharacterized protein LOC135388682 n=1 Tax=Ornithodoros turicata TaxID=34597 RepID=UPI003139A028
MEQKRGSAAMKAILILAFVTTAVGIRSYSDSVLTRYFDALSGTILPVHLQSRPVDLDLVDFDFVVPRNWMTNRKVNAQFHHGLLTGLTAINPTVKADSCSRVNEGDNFTMDCTLALGNLKATYDGFVDGESFFGSGSNLSVEADLVHPRGYVEITFFQTGPPVMKSWRVVPLDITLHYSRDLNLNPGRKANFEVELKRHIGIPSQSDSFLSRYYDALSDTILPLYLQKRPAEWDLVDFDFVVPRNWITNRKVNAQFHHGLLTGLTAINPTVKADNCSRVNEGDNFTMDCALAFGNLKVTYDGFVDGESFFGSGSNLSVEADLVHPKGYAEITFFQTGAPVMKSWRVVPLDITLHYSRGLNLNSGRKANFDGELKRHIGNAVGNILNGPFREDLNSSVPLSMLYVLHMKDQD